MPDDVLKTVPKTKAFSLACDVQAWVESCLDGWRPQQDGYYYPEMLYEDDGTLSESRLMLAARYATEKNRLRRWWIGWWHDGKHYLKCAYQWQLIYGLQGNTQIATTLSQKLSQAMKQWTDADDAHARTVPTPAQILNWRQFAFFRSPMPLGQFSKNLSDWLSPFIRLSELMQIRERLLPPADWQKRIDFEGDRIDGSPIQDVAERVRAYQRRGWFGRLWMRWWTDRGIQAQQRLYFYYQAQWTQTMVRQASPLSDSHDKLATLPQAYASVKACLEKNYPQEKRSIPRIAHQVASLPEMAMDEKYPILLPSQMRKAQVVVSQGIRRDWQAFQMHALGLWQQAIREHWQELLDFFAGDFDGSNWDAQWKQVDRTLQTAEAQLSREHSFFKSLIQATALAHSHQLETLNTFLNQGKALMTQSRRANQLWDGTFKTAREILGYAQYYRKLIAQCQAYPQTLLMPGHQLFQSAHGCLTRRFASLVAEQQAILVAQTPKIHEALIAEMSALCREFGAEGEHWARWEVDVNSMAELNRRLETLEQGELSQRYARVCWTLEFLNERQMDAGCEEVVCSEDLTASRQHWLAQQVRAIANEIEALAEQLKMDARDSLVDEIAFEQGKLQIPIEQWRVWMNLYQRYEVLQKMLQKVGATFSQDVLNAVAMWEATLIDSLEYWLDAHRVRIVRDTQQLTKRWFEQSTELAQLGEHSRECRLYQYLLDKPHHAWIPGEFNLQNILSEEVYQRYEGLRLLLQRMVDAKNFKNQYPSIYMGKARAKEKLEKQFQAWFMFRCDIIEKELENLAEFVTQLNDPEILGETQEHRRCFIDPSSRWLDFSRQHRDLRAVLQRMRVCVSQEGARTHLMRLDAIWQEALNQKSQSIERSMQTFEDRLAEIGRLARQDWFEGRASWSKMRWLMWQAESQQHYKHLRSLVTLLEGELLPGQINRSVVELGNSLTSVWQSGCETQQLWEVFWEQESVWREPWEALKQCGALHTRALANEPEYQTKKHALAELIKNLVSSESIQANTVTSFVKALLMDFENRLEVVNQTNMRWRDTSNEWALVPYVPDMQSNTLIYKREVFEQVGQGHLFQYAIFCAIASLRRTAEKEASFANRVLSIVEAVQHRYEKPCRKLYKENTQLMGKLHTDRDPDMLPSFSKQTADDVVNTTNIDELIQAVEAEILAKHQAVTEGEQKRRKSQLQALELRLSHLCATRAYHKGGLLHPREAKGYTILVDVQSKLDGFVSPLEQRDMEGIAEDYKKGTLKEKLEQVPVENMSLAEYVVMMWVDPERYEKYWMRCWEACNYHQTYTTQWTEFLVQVSNDTFREHAACQYKVKNLHLNTMKAIVKEEQQLSVQKDAEIARLEKELLAAASQGQEDSKKRDTVSNTSSNPMGLFKGDKNNCCGDSQEDRHTRSERDSFKPS